MTTPAPSGSTIIGPAQNHAISTATANSNRHQQTEIELPAGNKIYTTPNIWPLAAGWWVLIILLMVILGFASYKGYRYRQMKQQQNAILSALETINKTLQRDKSSAAITQINQLLRRLALMHFPRQQVANLTGKQWLAFLDKTGKTTAFSKGAGRILADGPYVAHLPNSIDHQGLVAAVKQWLTYINSQYHQQKSYRHSIRKRGGN